MRIHTHTDTHIYEKVQTRQQSVVQGTYKIRAYAYSKGDDRHGGWVEWRQTKAKGICAVWKCRGRLQERCLRGRSRSHAGEACLRSHCRGPLVKTEEVETRVRGSSFWRGDECQSIILGRLDYWIRLGEA